MGHFANVSKLVSIMAIFAKIPSFLQYSEDYESPLNKSAILRLAPMFKQLFQVEGFGPMAQKPTEKIFAALQEQCEHQWARKLSPEETKHWLATMSRQFRTIVRHIVQARRKGAKWVAELFGQDDEAQEPDHEAHEPDHEAQEEEEEEEDAIEEEQEEEPEEEAAEPTRPPPKRRLIICNRRLPCSRISLKLGLRAE